MQKYAKFIEISDIVRQVKFHDGIDILISEEKEIAQYVDENNNQTMLSLVNIMQNPNKDFAKRFKYIKKVNIEEIKYKINIKIGLENNE